MESENVVKADQTRLRQAAAELRVSSALRDIQEAQQLLGRATELLCSIVGMLPEWEKVGDLYDQVHSGWYLVRDRASELRRPGSLLLDHELTSRDEEWKALQNSEVRS